MMAGHNTACGPLAVTMLISLSLLSARYSVADNSEADTGSSPSASHEANQVIVDQGKACTRIQARLDRLTCFDDLFNTPIMEQVRKKAEEDALPAAWHRALANEQHRTDETGFLLNPSAQEDSAQHVKSKQQPAGTHGKVTDNSAGLPPSLWATAPALGVLPPRPVLMFSCIDKISRAELILPDALDGARLYLKLQGKKALDQRWISDESGLVLRSGRGIPAIQAMRTALSGQQLVLVSQNGTLQELMFDTRGLSEVLKPMREVCRW